MDPPLLRQLLRRQNGVLTGAGQFGADVDVDDVVPLRQQRGEERLEFLRADRRGLGQRTVPAVVGVQLRRGIAPVIEKDPLPALDGQGHGADMETLQQPGRQVAGAVVGDADRSGHGIFLLFSYVRGSIPEEPQRRLKKSSIFGSACDKIQIKRKEGRPCSVFWWLRTATAPGF